ncbi:MAG TPA: hypothetical protein VNF47_09725 [Streptosporangiaceae bacterium]|nr:hypothetical protein [Streptosporangiaceae bacterium]
MLRLAMATGTVAAGCCLVLAMVSLVVAMGQTRVDSTASSHAFGDQPTGPGGTGGTGTGASPGSSASPGSGHDTGATGSIAVGATLARFSGTGMDRTAFVVGKPGDWGLSWRFACFRTSGGFLAVHVDNVQSARHVRLSTSGSSGHGLAWSSRDPGRHSVTIMSDCAWVVEVVLPRH